jgi:hypothetical protein
MGELIARFGRNEPIAARSRYKAMSFEDLKTKVAAAKAK